MPENADSRNPGCDETVRRLHRGVRRDLPPARGGGGGHHRPERRREDHLLQPAHGHVSPHGGDGAVPGGRRHPLPGPRARRPRRHPDLPARFRLRPALRPGEPRPRRGPARGRPLRGKGGFFFGDAGRREIAEACGEALALVGLEGKASRATSSLSYGDKRKLEIALALSLRPSVLLLDEPFAGLSDGGDRRGPGADPPGQGRPSAWSSSSTRFPGSSTSSPG